MNKKMFNLKSRKGFTLIELIVVMVIIGILVALAAPKFLGYNKDAEVSAMRADAKVLSNASALYNIENNGAWPNSAAAVTPLDAGLATYLGTKGYLAGDTVVGLDDVKLKDYVKSIKNNYTDYILVTSGKLTGEVFHKTGVADKNGTERYGVAN